MEARVQGFTARPGENEGQGGRGWRPPTHASRAQVSECTHLQNEGYHLAPAHPKGGTEPGGEVSSLVGLGCPSASTFR